MTARRAPDIAGAAPASIKGTQQRVPDVAAPASIKGTQQRVPGVAAPSSMKGTRLRVLGVVYTPPAVAAELVAHALDPIVAPMVAARDAGAIRALRICDPAVGEGAIAVAIVEYLEHALGAIRGAGVPAGDDASAAREDRAAAGRCVVGMDIDGAALAVAAARVPGADLREGDALTAAWETFDAVVANPPYIRGERIADKRALAAFAVYEPTADLYAYFIELAHRIVRPGGRYAIVVPQKWMTAAYGRNLRALLAQSVHGIVSAREFPDADAFPCIVWGATAPAPAPLLVATDRGARTRASLGDGAAPWHLDGADVGALLDRLARAFPPLAAQIADRPQRGVVTGCNAAFVVDRATRDALVATDPANAALVRPLVRGRDLVHLARRGSREDVDLARRGDVDIARDAARVATVPADAVLARDRGQFVLLIGHGTEPTPSILAHLAAFRARLEPGGPGGRKPGRYRWFELQDPLNHALANPAPRILYQDIQSAPLAALDDGASIPDTTLWMLPTADPWILAVLRSPLYAFHARHRFPPALNGSWRPKWEYLRALPIAPAPPGWAANAAEAVADAYALTAAERRLVAMPSTSSSNTPTTSATSATLNTGHR